MGIQVPTRDDVHALSKRVLDSLPRSAQNADGTWDDAQLSAALRRFYAELQQQIAANEAELNVANIAIIELSQRAPSESEAFNGQIDAVLEEVGHLDRRADAAASHFDQLWHLLEPATQKLQALEARASYLATAIEIEKHSQQTKASAVEATAAALEAFQAFSAFVQTIPAEYTSLKREAVCRVEDLSFGIKQYAVDKLQRALEEIEWPKPMEKQALADQAGKLREVAQAFAYLVTLHVSQLNADSSSSTSDSQPTELWAIECLLEPLRMRFRYHFDRADSKTNRVTKPEWFLAHVLEQTRVHHEFLLTVVSPELQKHSNSLDCVNAQILLLRGLILTASKKLAKDVPAIVADPAVFCHVIDEVLLFEQAVDQEFGYASVAMADPATFPRVVDVLTADPKTLFAWTKIDLDFAKQVLQDEILSRGDAWQRVSASVTTPVAAHHFVALLDFMCRRFAHFGHEGHRFLYISEVHFVLLHAFHRACGQQLGTMDISAVVDRHGSLAPVFQVVTGAQYVVDVLGAWEGSPVFLELLRKVAESATSRSQILRMHLTHSKTVLTNAAKAATETIMAREEAMAVRQAIAGPGAMIGPTAAFSAAYSVGSKTVKSLFGRGEAGGSSDASVDTPAPPSMTEDCERVLRPSQSQLMIEAEELLFSRTMFEKQVQAFKKLVATTVTQVQDALLAMAKRSLSSYRKSPHWTRATAIDVLVHDVSPELTVCIDLLQRYMAEARTLLPSDDCFHSLWKPLTASLDDAIFAAVSTVMQPTGPPSSTGFSLSSAASAIGAIEPSAQSMKSWTQAARHQFVVDVNAIAAAFQPVCTRHARAYLRKAFDVCRVVEMAPTKLREIREALREEEDGSMEQITTMLEACGLATLTPAQVQTLCETQLGLP